MFFELIFYYGGRAKILEVVKLRSMDSSLLRELLDLFSGTERSLYIYIYIYIYLYIYILFSLEEVIFQNVIQGFRN